MAPTDLVWHVGHHRGPVADLHALALPADGRRHVWVLEATGPSIVLGSTQPADVVDIDVARDAGVSVVRRRSGGGAVWVDPATIWVDIVVPAGDPLWEPDVGRAFAPVGLAWREALGEVGVDVGGPLTVHDGRLLTSTWSALVCFAGIGPGEVLAGDAKVVGISQRRTRAGVRFQCALYARWDPAPLCALLVGGPAPDVLAPWGAGIGTGVDRNQLVGALVDALGERSLR